MKRVKDKAGRFTTKLQPHHEKEIAKMIKDEIDANQIIARIIIMVGCSPRTSYTYLHKIGKKVKLGEI